MRSVPITTDSTTRHLWVIWQRQVLRLVVVQTVLAQQTAQRAWCSKKQQEACLEV